ncbi:hypothetical protein ACLQ18_37740 [Streptomyces sp. DT193]|uniref:hypothetical protein n=1 Tax=Streptomyces sp. DT193 TaxID=3393418 RepID=UPI003CFA05CD
MTDTEQGLERRSALLVLTRPSYSQSQASSRAPEVNDEVMVRSATAIQRSASAAEHSKVLMDQAPVVIHDGIPEEAAEIAVAALREAGAQADVRPQQRPGSPDPAV